MLYTLLQNQTIYFQSVIIFIASLIFTTILMPLFVSFVKNKKMQQIIRILGPESHYHKSGTPTAGGVIFISVPLIVVLLFFPLHNAITWILFFTFLCFALLGLADDLKKIVKKDHLGVTPKQKIILQTTISAVLSYAIYSVVGTNLYLPIPFIEQPIMDLQWLFFLFVIFLIVSWSNAFNLTDGLDGLVTGLSIFVAIPLIIIGFVETNSTHVFLPNFESTYLVSFFMISLLASLLVFLWFNTAPAQIFMGDTGSLALGALFAVASLILKIEFLFAYIGILFVLENISVVIQVIYFKKTGKRFFKMAPLHHHFEYIGLTEQKIVIRAWIIQICIVISVIILLFYNKLSKYFFI